MERSVLVSDVAGVRTIKLNRPERKNALSPEMQTELTSALEAAATEETCRVVVLAGAGEAFCAGLDMVALQGLGDGAEHKEEAERIARMFWTLYSLPKPTIAAVHGVAVAGGTGLATMCDFTLAARGVKFGYTEARVGFVAAIVSAYLVLQVGDKRARDLLLTGRLFTAEEGFRLGLVTEVVAAEDLAAHVETLANVLSKNSPEAMRATKELLMAESRYWLELALKEAMRASTQALQTHDFKEGIAAFLEKRKPVWG